MLVKENSFNKKNVKVGGRLRKKEVIQEPWFLYIIRCIDKTLYTGITKDLDRRFKMHNDGKASRYTRTRRPVKLVYKESCSSRVQALVRECKIKAFSKEKKERLVKTKII